MSRSNVVWLLMVVVLVVGIAAQEEPAAEATEPAAYDYADYNTYQNPAFYRDSDSDPAQWDWTQVNWVVFDFEREDVYDVPAFYQNLPIERYSDVNYRLVPDFEMISDHSFIDGNKFVQDFGCRGCSFEAASSLEGGIYRDEAENLVYDNDGSIFHTTTGDFIYSGEFSPGVSFLATDKGFEVRYPEGTTEIDPPARGGSYTVMIEGGALEYRGNFVESALSFREGQPYIKGYDVLIINDILITYYGEAGMNLYFDGLYHDGDYVSIGGPLAFGGNRIIIESLSGDTTYAFLTGNNFFDIPPGEDGDTARNALIFELTAGSTLSIEERSEQKLIPLVLAEGTIRIINGRLVTSLRPDIIFPTSTLSISFEGESRLSTPLALQYALPSSEGLPPRQIFDANNNFIIVEEGELPLTEVECTTCALDFQRSRLLYNHYLAQILGHTTIIDPLLDVERDFLIVGHIATLLNSLPPAVQESIREIQIVPDDRIEEFCRAENSVGCTNNNGRIIISASVSRGTVHHEGAHALDFFIARDDRQNVLEEQAEVQQLLQTYGTLENVPTTIWEQIVREAAQRPENFRKQWLDAAGGENFYEQMQSRLARATGGSPTIWSDGSLEPRFGCFHPYGCSHLQEDIATAVEPFSRGEYPFVAGLINPASNFYQEMMGIKIGDTGLVMTPKIAEDWAQRYRARVDLLYDEFFITEEQYRSVISSPEEQQAANDENEGAGYGP